MLLANVADHDNGAIKNTSASSSTTPTTRTTTEMSNPPITIHKTNEGEGAPEFHELAILPIHRTSHKLPKWMLDYFQWHQSQRAALTTDNWDSGTYKFLIMRCLQDDKICGGTSDRLQSLPYVLLLAYTSHRILFIYWKRPFRLEEFLLPPHGGLDWRVPSFMVDHLPPHTDVPLTFAPRAARLLPSKQMESKLIVYTRDQTHNHGKSVYDQYHEYKNHTSRFDQVFSDAWRMVLTPVPSVATRIQKWMQSFGLVPGAYVAAHCRALYGVHNRSLDEITEWTQTAIRCATQVRPEGPVFFASDSTHAQKVALDYGNEQHVTVVSRFHEKEPLHLEVNATGKIPADYYDIFVDLYLLGNSRGMAFNVGGYGKLGLILGFDSTAGIQYQQGGVPWKGGMTQVKVNQCELKKRPMTTITQDVSTIVSTHQTSSFFVPPVDATKS